MAVFVYCSFFVFFSVSTAVTISPRSLNTAQNELVNFTCFSANEMIVVLSVTTETNILDIIQPIMSNSADHSATFVFLAEENASVVCIDILASGIQLDASGRLFVQGIHTFRRGGAVDSSSVFSDTYP